MFRFAIERGIILAVGFLALCLLGVIAMRTVPVQMTPDIERPVITAITVWPGATPLDVEKEILIEQEEYLRNVRGLGKMTATASMGRAEIELEFALGTDMAEALVLVNNALSQVQAYPENVDQPRLISSSATDDPFIFYTLSRLPGSSDFPPVYQYLDYLQDHYVTRLERVPGVSQVMLRGGASREVKVIVDPARLASRQLSMADVRAAIRDRNQDQSGGDIDAGKRRYVLRTIGRYDSLETIEDTILAERGGHSVRLKDVGRVDLAFAELQGKSYVGDRRSLIMMIQREPGANVIEVKRGVTAVVDELNASLLKDMNLVATLYADDVGYVVDAVRVVRKNLLLGGALACLVLFLFLRSVYPTLLGALGVPVCTIGAFIGLLLLGRTVNVISLAGVAFAIGATLDNSIVVLENIYRHRLAGKSPFQASLDGVGEMWKAVLASTLTTVIVFLPVSLIEDEAGQLYSDIAIAISAAVLMSMLVATTLVPSAAARLQIQAPPADSRLSVVGRRISQGLLFVLEKLLSGIWRPLLLLFITLFIALAIIVKLTPQAEYLPEGEEPKLFAFMLPPAGYNLEEMDRLGQALAADIVEGSAEQGLAIPPLDYFLWVATTQRLFIVTAPLDPGPQAVEALQSALTQRLSEVPGMLAFVNKGSIFSGNTGGTRSIELEISGPDLASNFALARQAYQLAKAALGTPQIRPDPGLSLGQPSIEVRPDWERARELGLPARELGYTVWALADGAFVDEFFLADDKIDMYLYSSEGTVERPEDLADLPLYTPAGGVLPLSSLAEIRETVSANRIRRVDGDRSVTLTIVPPRDIPLERAVQLIQREVIDQLRQQGRLQGDVNLRIGGASDKLRSVRDALAENFVVAIVLAYLLMVAIFSHWGYPLLILCSLPLGISGGIAGLWFMNTVMGIRMPLDMLTMLGMIVLIGTVVNNPILLVEQARRNLAHGEAPLAAVLDSVRLRLRPIMMSMLTTIFGLAPVVFLPGAGTELYRGLGTIVLFGLFFSTLLTLSFIPALLVLVFGATQRWRQG